MTAKKHQHIPGSNTNPPSNKADDVAARLEAAKKAQEMVEERLKAMYALEPFETIRDQNGSPLICRVPGGWIFYTWFSSGIGDAAHCDTVFVPWNAEYLDTNGAVVTS